MFKIRSDERLISIVFVIIAIIFNTIYIYQFYGIFWPKVSGYDPWVHSAITDWVHAPYVHQDSFVHSLFAFFLFPLYGLNYLCSKLFGFNCADFIIAIVLVFNSLYSFIFLKRIFSEIVGISNRDSIILCILFFSFAYIMLMIVVPEHFPFSMFLLITLLYIAGCKIKNKQLFSNWNIIILYILIAGITITNGIKVILSFLFVNGINSNLWKKIIVLFVLPTIFMFTLAGLGIKLTKDTPFSRKVIAEKYEKTTRIIRPCIDESKELFSVEELVEFENKIRNSKNKDEKSQKNLISTYKSFIKENSSHHSFIKVITCNFFGESLQFHRKGFLNDRMIYGLYKNPINHIVQFTLLFVALWGLILGWKDKFLRLCLSFFAFDFTLHIIFGFAFSEVYIMTPHWAFFIPICIGYLFKYGKNIKLIRTVAIILTAFLLSYNGFLLIRYFY